MSESNQDYEQVLVAGSFNAIDSTWQRGIEMIGSGDGIYTTWLEVDPGASHEYIFAITGSQDGLSGWGQVSTATLGAACDFTSTDEWANYGFKAPSGCGAELALPVYAWGRGCVESTGSAA
jgi:hypothetical protein